jgi:hypothetical protein
VLWIGSQPSAIEDWQSQSYRESFCPIPAKVIAATAFLAMSIASSACWSVTSDLLAFPPTIVLELTPNLVLERIPHALHTRASRQHALALVLVLALPHFCDSVNNARNEANEDSAAAGKCGGRVEEDETGKGNGQLVEGANHGVGCGGGDAYAPCGAV